ncbi:MAG TPA: hypothetical protein VFK31_01805 [Rhodanobacteraceae bacterium]|nr:hypothetical protein [Rhodanobacteraceae bacterium]
MAQNAAAKLARIRRITKRQHEPAWGRDYDPAIHATPQEAPKCSRPTILKPSKLGMRDMHLLSGVEARAALLALYNPNVFDVHEQHALSREPTQHPLASHPMSVGKQFPPINGTVSVAARLGHCSWHGRVYLEEVDRWLPDIYVGDLLLFLNDADGAYVVNWTVKAEDRDFNRPGPHPYGRPRRGTSARVVFRHDLEVAYFSDAGVRTQRVVDPDMDATLFANLRVLFGYHALPSNVPPAERQNIEDSLSRTVGGTTRVWTTLQAIAQERHMEAEAIRTLLYQAIWARRILVDLYQPLMIDKPLRTETRDPLRTYASWFSR